MNKHFLNEEGITLTELLAALSLFAVVSALVMTVLFNVFQNSENISDNAQLRQDANLLVSTLRSHYNQGDFEVGLNPSKSLLIGGQEVNSSMTSSIDELELINGGNSISAADQSMIVKADGTPLSIDLTLKNEAGQTYNLFTTIEKPAEQAIALLPVPPEPSEPENWTPGGPGGGEGKGGEPWECIDKDSDVKYDDDNNNQIIPDYCEGEITIKGNVWVSDHHNHNVVEMKHNGAKINIRENFFVDSEFNIDNQHSVTVKGDALFNGKLELKETGTLLVDQNIHAVGVDHNGNAIVVGNYTELKAGKSIVVDGDFHILDNGHAEIGKNLIIDGNLKMYNYAKITVEGNARINGNLILGKNSKLTIKGNLTVTGDVKQDNDKNNRTIYVGGDANFSKGEPEWLTVSEDVNGED